MPPPSSSFLASRAASLLQRGALSVRASQLTHSANATHGLMPAGIMTMAATAGAGAAPSGAPVPSLRNVFGAMAGGQPPSLPAIGAVPSGNCLGDLSHTYGLRQPAAMMCMPAASAAAATPEAAPGARPTPCACSACRRAHAPQQHQRWAHQASHQMQQARGYYAGGEPGMAAGHGYLREYHGTTILCVRKGNKVVLIGDGQVSLGPTIVKPNAKKVRRIGDGVVAGFAGSAADGLSLLERLEMKLEEHPGVCAQPRMRACACTHTCTSMRMYVFV
mmetsp:Transcript_16280/g.48489  ORF Transcript_16280/g.48489 Transcript_16280/m.48489 type:complete len:276 (-) Transcript_16280:140-967(-)